MSILIVRDARSDVSPKRHLRLPTRSSAVCRCGAVFDYGNIVVPLESRELCGRCAAKRVVEMTPARS